MVNIGIIGYGFVGKAIEYGFKVPGNIIKIYDKYKETDSFEEVVDSSDFIFVALPTPFKEKEMKIDLGIMDENIEKIAQRVKGKKKIIIIKSTVVPGTTSNYSRKYPDCLFCANPEFLTEANYLADFIGSERRIIGADNDQVRRDVIGLYMDRFPDAKIFGTDSKTAEMVKYMSNCFLATKVTFANEIYDICQKLGVNYDEVKDMVAADNRIGPAHFKVTSQRGFGGKCFPKDLVALIGLCNDLKVDASLLESVWEKNLKLRKVKDWEEIPFVKT